MSEERFDPWAELVQVGTRTAMSKLAEMVGTTIVVNDLTIREVPVDRLAYLFGGPEQEAVGIHLGVSGSAEGHLMLMYEPSIAHTFVDLLMGQPPGTTQALDEMGNSALGEMGNIIGAFFLGAIADATGLSLQPSPPEVRADMAGALLDAISAEILLHQDEAAVAEAAFSASGHDIEGLFMAMPTPELLEALTTASGAAPR